jgi:hypothetical protein
VTECGLDLLGFMTGKVAGFYEHSNEPKDFIQQMSSINYLSSSVSLCEWEFLWFSTSAVRSVTPTAPKFASHHSHKFTRNNHLIFENESLYLKPEVTRQ